MKMMMSAEAMVVAMPATARVVAPAEFGKAAGASDLYERQSSELVRQSTRNVQVRRFADMMIGTIGRARRT